MRAQDLEAEFSRIVNNPTLDARHKVILLELVFLLPSAAQPEPEPDVYWACTECGQILGGEICPRCEFWDELPE
jgi:hypothetical protein